MPAGSGEGGRMDDRKLTVYNGRGAFKKSPPQILLQGNWLEQAGFSAGDKITVKWIFCKVYSLWKVIAV